ncbi:MAG: 3-phosphoglycerate dehydrogenase [Saprospiraceae bacterium]|nr:3-phosphoglycerate dehydrogenase [Saprospiraceae bacterium]
MQNWKILINDGLENSGIEALKQAGFELQLDKIPQEELIYKLNNFDGILVRSATKVRKDLIDQCPNLKFIGRGGVGLDNIDVDYARSRNIAVINTPAASSRSVAELALGHIISLTRKLHEANRNLINSESFISLKKKFSNSTELKDKNLILIGFGRIGYELAKIALGLEMKVMIVDPFIDKARIEMKINNQKLEIELPIISKDKALEMADYISLHAPYSGDYLLVSSDFNRMKKNCIVINTSRGENIDEDALLSALDNDIIAGAGLDVFHNEPKILNQFYNHPKISITPHVGASTIEAQERIASELVEKIVELRSKLC